MLDHILLADHGMHVYSRLIVISFLIIAVINFGKGLDFKVDNVFITMGTIYLALTGFSLSLDKGVYCFYGWLYGFSWSLGLEFFSDPRSLTYGGAFFDGSFIQNSKSSAHFLLFVDDNFLRNCWSIFILLFVIISLLTFSWIITKLFT